MPANNSKIDMLIVVGRLSFYGSFYGSFYWSFGWAVIFVSKNLVSFSCVLYKIPRGLIILSYLEVYLSFSCCKE